MYMDYPSSNGEYVMYEIPGDIDEITIKPVKDNASFIYMGKEYKFGNVNDKTYATLKLASKNEETVDLDSRIEIYNTPGYGVMNPTSTVSVIDDNTSSSEATTEATQPSTEQAQPSTEQVQPGPQEQITINRIPSKIVTKVKKNKVTITWKKINKKHRKLLALINGIQIQYSTDPAFEQNVINKTVGKNKTKRVLKLQSKTTYYIRLRYVGATGVSNWSAVKRIRTK